MKKMALAAALALSAGAASAKLPIFAAKCPTGITTDSDERGRVYVNGKISKLTQRPGGQVTAQSAGVYIDITPQGNEPPIVSYTAKNKANGMCEVVSFQAPGGAGAAAGGAAPRESTAARAGQGKFDATGQIPCAQQAGQPMGQCKFGVAREPGGSATLVVTRPDGRTRAIFFEKGKAVGADMSQADGNMRFRARKNADLFMIDAGDERYEIPDAAVFGG
jgi:hypothetical protein